MAEDRLLLDPVSRQRDVERVEFGADVLRQDVRRVRLERVAVTQRHSWVRNETAGRIVQLRGLMGLGRDGDVHRTISTRTRLARRPIFSAEIRFTAGRPELAARKILHHH